MKKRKELCIYIKEEEKDDEGFNITISHIGEQELVPYLIEYYIELKTITKAKLNNYLNKLKK